MDFAQKSNFATEPIQRHLLDAGRITSNMLSSGMIKRYRDRQTQRFADGQRIRVFQGFARQAEKRLETLDAAESLQDLRSLHSNRLEALKGDREGQFSIRINNQWRICFEWPEGDDGPSNVEITDYH